MKEKIKELEWKLKNQEDMLNIATDRLHTALKDIQRLRGDSHSLITTAWIELGRAQVNNSVIGPLLAGAVPTVQQAARVELDKTYEALKQTHSAEDRQRIVQGFLEQARALFPDYAPVQP